MADFPLRSTGQTADDLSGLAIISNITGWNLTYHPAEDNPDYAPPNAGKPIPFVVICVIVASIGMVYMRLISTHRNRRTPMKALLFLEDWLIVLALALIIGLCGLSLTGYYRWQWGWHGWDVRLSNYIWNYKIFYIWFVINLWASCAIRASLVLTVRRMYSPFKTKILHLCDFLLGLKVMLVISGTIGITFACGVNMDILNVYKWSDKCDEFIYTMALCAAGVLLDLIIISLPIPLIFKLKRLTRRRKVEMCIIFCLGFLAVGASCVRMYCFVSDVDPNTNSAYLAIASLVELCISICTTCIPSARVLFLRLYSPDRSLFDVKAYFRKESIAEPLFAFASSHARPKCKFTGRTRKRTSRIVSAITGVGTRTSESERGSGHIRMSQVPTQSTTTTTSVMTSVFEVDVESGIKDKDYSTSKVHLEKLDTSSSTANHTHLQPPNKALTILGRRQGTGMIDENIRISIAVSNCGAEEEDDEMDGDLIMLPEPSDAFFPWATALSPRPTPSRR